MNILWNSAFGLLLVTGGLLGLTLPFGKMATEAGVPALVWAFVISLGAGGVLLVALLAHGRAAAPHRAQAALFRRSRRRSPTPFPTCLMFSAIPHLGAGYTGIMFTLSPVITLVLSILLGVRRPNLLGVAGIAVGFVGAVMVAVTRGEAGQPAELFWVVVGLLIPVSLAVGQHLPHLRLAGRTGPIELAVGSHLPRRRCCWPASSRCRAAVRSASWRACRCWRSRRSPSASAMFAFFFRLQAVGGPVYLSQIGYVGGGGRPVFRHAVPRRALPVADLDRRADH